MGEVSQTHTFPAECQKDPPRQRFSRRRHFHRPRTRRIHGLHRPQSEILRQIRILNRFAAGVESGPQIFAAAIKPNRYQSRRVWRNLDDFHCEALTHTKDRTRCHSLRGIAEFGRSPPVPWSKKSSFPCGVFNLTKEANLGFHTGRRPCPQRCGERGSIVDHEKIAGTQKPGQFRHQGVFKGSAFGIEHQQSRRIPRRAGLACGYHATSTRDATTRAPVWKSPAWRMMSHMRSATSSGFANVAGPASGIASACIRVSISPGSMLIN